MNDSNTGYVPPLFPSIPKEDAQILADVRNECPLLGNIDIVAPINQGFNLERQISTDVLSSSPDLKEGVCFGITSRWLYEQIKTPDPVHANTQFLIALGSGWDKFARTQKTQNDLFDDVRAYRDKRTKLRCSQGISSQTLQQKGFGGLPSIKAEESFLQMEMNLLFAKNARDQSGGLCAPIEVHEGNDMAVMAQKVSALVEKANGVFALAFDGQSCGHVMGLRSVGMDCWFMDSNGSIWKADSFTLRPLLQRVYLMYYISLFGSGSWVLFKYA